MGILTQFGTEHYGRKVGIILKTSVNIVNFYELVWFGVDTCRPKFVDTVRPNLLIILVSNIYILGISRHFNTKNYMSRLAIVQNLCEYCQFFLCDFLGPNYAIVRNIFNTHYRMFLK